LAIPGLRGTGASSTLPACGRMWFRAQARSYSAWGRNPPPVPFPGRRREYIPVGLDVSSLKHTLPEKAPRPGSLVVLAPQCRSNLRIHSVMRRSTQRPRTGSGEFFLDRRQQGGDCSRQSSRISSIPGGRCWRGAYRDRIHGVSRERVPAPGCAPKRTSGEEFTGKYLRFVLIRLNAYCARTRPRTWRAARE